MRKYLKGDVDDFSFAQAQEILRLGGAEILKEEIEDPPKYFETKRRKVKHDTNA